MLTLRDALLGLFLPALVATASLLVAWRPWARGGSAERGAWGGALALALAYAAGHAGLLGPPPLPPREATHWIVLLGLGAAVLAILEAVVRGLHGLARWAPRILLIAFALWVLLSPLRAYTWGSGQAWAWHVALAALGLGIWAGVEHLPDKAPLAAGWLVLLVVTGSAALALSLSGSLVLARLAGALAAGTAAALAVSLLPGGRGLARASTAVPVLLIHALLVTGFFYADLPAPSALLLAAAAVVAAILPARVLRSRSAAMATLIHGAAALVPAVAAVTLAWLASPSF